MATNSCGVAGVNCGGDRVVTGCSKGRRVAVVMQVVTVAVITDWSKWGRVVVVGAVAIDCLILAGPNGEKKLLWRCRW